MQLAIYLLFNISGGEIILILLIILVFFGAKSIPTFARIIGRGIKQFKDASQDIQRDILDNSKELRDNFDIKDKDL